MTTRIDDVRTEDQSYGYFIDPVCDLLSKIWEAVSSFFAGLFHEEPPSLQSRLFERITFAEQNCMDIRRNHQVASPLALFTRVSINKNETLHHIDLHELYETWPTPDAIRASFADLKNRCSPFLDGSSIRIHQYALCRREDCLPFFQFSAHYSIDGIERTSSSHSSNCPNYRVSNIQQSLERIENLDFRNLILEHFRPLMRN